ncbi:MAG: hypothetical protein RLZZ347_368 [Candidatus Parcubacteria bacterium]
MSYSQIKEELGVSKSTLSGWLRNMPLSEERIKELGALNPMRIERCRNTKMRKRQDRLDSVFRRVIKDIGVLSRREIFLTGFFLYWGEGWKSTKATMALTNTNPQMMKYFMRWIETLGVDKRKVKVSLQLYSDMDIQKQISFWAKELSIPRRQFRKPYVKESRLSDITYKTGFGHGTCSVIIENRDIAEYVLMGVKSLSEMCGSKNK